MENTFMVSCLLLTFLMEKAELLKGKGVCSKDDDVKYCCYGFIERESFCISCPAGTYGRNCTSVCPRNKFGQHCSKECNCSNTEICNPVSGCEDKSIYLHNTSAATTVGISSDQVAMGTTKKDSLPCGNQDEGLKISHVDIINFGALLALIALVIINIVISKTHVMEVKHEVYPIIENCYNGKLTKPRISREKLARESKRQISKQLSAVIDMSKDSRNIYYENVELAGGFVSNTDNSKTKQIVSERAQELHGAAQNYFLDNVMDNKEYFSIDEL